MKPQDSDNNNNRNELSLDEYEELHSKWVPMLGKGGLGESDSLHLTGALHYGQ